MFELFVQKGNKKETQLGQHINFE